MTDFTDLKKEREDIQQIFSEVLENTSIPTEVEFRLMGNTKLKKLYKIQKLSDLYTTLSKGVNFAIIINEELFDQLPDDMQILMFEEALAGISYNLDTDKILLERPDFSTYSSLLEKRGGELLIQFKESVRSLIEAKMQKEKDEREAKQQEKMGKRKK